MKKIVLILSCIFIHDATHACLQADVRDYLLEKQDVARHFSAEGKCLLPKGSFPEVEQRLKNLATQNPDDEEVQFCLASFLTSRGIGQKSLEGLGLISSLVMRHDFQDPKEACLFGDTFGTLQLHFPGAWRGKNFSTILGIWRFFSQKNLSQPRVYLKPLKDAMETFFHVFNTCPEPVRSHPALLNALDASVCNIMGVIKQRLASNMTDSADAKKEELIVSSMFSILEKEKLFKTPYTKGHLASMRFKQGCNEEAAQIFTTILGTYGELAKQAADLEDAQDPYVQTLHRAIDYPYMLPFYGLAGVCYTGLAADYMLKTRDLETAYPIALQARAAYEMCLEHEDPRVNHSGTRFELARTLILLLEYDEASRVLKDLLRQPSKILRHSFLDKKIIRSKYLESLEKAGNDKALAKIQMRRQTKILNRAHKQGKLIHDAVTLERQQTQAKLQAEENEHLQRQKHLALLQEIRARQAERTLSDFIAYSSSSQEVPKPPRFIPAPERVKHKTRGVGYALEGPSSSSPAAVPQEPMRLAASQFLSGNPLRIFNKFFESRRHGVSDQKIKIPLDEVETLMDALDQVFDPRSGKGSHTKVTFESEHLLGDGTSNSNSNSNSSSSSSSSSQVLTLAKHKDLKPYQIKQMREMFEAYGLYPDDLLAQVPTQMGPQLP